MTDQPIDVSEPSVLAVAREAYAARPVAMPPSLVDAAMATVRTELRPARRLTVEDQHGYVTDTAVANAIRLVLDDDPAIVARSCRVEATAPVVDDTGGWLVTLTVAISYRHFERHGDDVVRARVIGAAGRLFGATVAAVDIDVVDVFGDGPTVRHG